MIKVMTKLGEGGRLVIPAEYRKAMGVDTGDDLALILEENSLWVLAPAAGIRRAQALVGSYIPEGRCLSDELVEERRRSP